MSSEVEPHPALADHVSAIDQLRACGELFWRRGWSVGTSSNYSAVLQHEPLELVVTASGMDKGRLTRADFVRVGAEGKPTGSGMPKSSAETLLHCVAARQPNVGAVLHTHSVWGTILSDLFHQDAGPYGVGGFAIEGYEMLKGLAGVTTHEHRQWVPIFPNTQDIPVLAKQVAAAFADPERPLRHGYLIHRHGLYTWGRDIDEARRHIEIFEFLFETVARRMTLGR